MLFRKSVSLNLNFLFLKKIHKAGIFNYSIRDVLDQLILCEGCPVHCTHMMFSSIYDLYLLDAKSTHPSFVTIKNVCRRCQMSPGRQNCPIKNYCQKGKKEFGAKVFLFKLLIDNTNLLSLADSIYNLLTKGNYIGKSKTSMVSEWLKAWTLHLQIWVQQFLCKTGCSMN